MNKPEKIDPASGKLGILIPGMGAVATTFIAGVEAIKAGLGEPIGSLTQMGTIRLGKRTENRSPLIKNFVSLASLEDLVFGGWDVFPDNAYQAATHAEVLEKEGIHCNLTLLFGFSQAIACAEAGVTLISPFVGRILDWYKSETGKESYPGNEDPGVISVSKIYNYYKTHNYKTEVMGASFRNIDEILELAGCDLLTISPKFLKELENDNSKLARKLDPLDLSGSSDKIHLNEVDFKIMLKADRMASEKLQEGIINFSKAIEQLEIQLKERLCSIESDTEAVLSAR